MAGKYNDTGGLPIRRMGKRDREQLKRQEGRAGLWAGTGNTFFDHTRTMRTLDPSEYELELGMSGRNAVAWCKPLRENGNGRVVV